MMKPAYYGIFTFAIIACFIAGTLLTQPLLHAYAKKPSTGSYEFELRYLDGTLLTDYKWGQFTNGETKEFECELMYLGDMKAQVTWNAINLPEGVEIEVWDLSRRKPKLWDEDKTINLKPGISRDLKILLRNVDAEPGQYQELVLRFISMTPGQ
jgi:hypothetical protein